MSVRLLGAGGGGADVNRVCVCVCPPAAGGAVCILRAGDEHLQRARVSGAYFSCPHTSIADREQPSLSHWNGSATIK